MGRFSGKHVIVSGAAVGVGGTIAVSFAREGTDVAILDYQSAEATQALIAAQDRRCKAIRCDIRDEDEVNSGVAEAASFFGDRIDVLVNNAGFNGHYNLVKDMRLSDWRETLDINLTGTMLVTRAVLPFMIAARSGAIVTTASNVARRGLPFRADYVCSKWAIVGLTQTLALENARHNIRVNAVCPGPIEGDRIEEVMANQARVEGKTPADIRSEWANAAPMRRFIDPEEVAKAMLFLCSSESSAMTGRP